MDRIELTPGMVRGAGNIVRASPSLVSDIRMSMVGASIVKGSSTIDDVSMTSYTMSSETARDIRLDAPRWIEGSGDVTITVTGLSSGLTVKLELLDNDGELMGTTHTEQSSGSSVGFTVSISSEWSGYYTWKCSVMTISSGNVTWAYNIHKPVLIGATDLDFDFMVLNDMIQIDEGAYLIGTLTGTLGDESVGIPGHLVSFYEVWTPGLQGGSDESVIQSGDTVNLSAQLVDTVDGSLVREAGHDVVFFTGDNAPDILLCDPAQTDRTSQYTATSVQGSTPQTLIFDTDHYESTAGSNLSRVFLFEDVTLPTNCIIEADVKYVNNNIGLAISESNGDSFGWVDKGTYANRWCYISQGWSSHGASEANYSETRTGYVRFKIVKQGTSLAFTVTDGGTTLLSTTYTLPSGVSGDLYLGIFTGGSTGGDEIKNIIVYTESDS